MSDTPDTGELLPHQLTSLTSEPRERGRLHWHGEDDDGPMREWLVDQLLPKVGTALASGRWGTYKTLVVMDLAGAVMSRSSFAGPLHRTARRCRLHRFRRPVGTAYPADRHGAGKD